MKKAFVVDLDNDLDNIDSGSQKNKETLFNYHTIQGNQNKIKYDCNDNQAIPNIPEVADKIRTLIQKSLKNNEDILLKRNEIKEAFFNPLQERLSKTKIFLSHSHIDMKNDSCLGVKTIKSYLESTNYPNSVFIDSLFWDYKDDVLKEMAKYSDVSGIKDAFTLILRESLQDMIMKCPYFVFIKSSNSISHQGNSHITYSAWIYEELQIAHSLSKDNLTFSMENFKIEHDVSPLWKKFDSITLSDLSDQINLQGQA
ncbi:TIR domain protein [Helicobacter cetorum]|uniref:TIR domain protein n=1 Tax=Helicobacter cetorum TaxID=138563 RepID=UPI000CF0BD5B|nr:TIR domain protein [Helicobacter cetorum]